MLSNLFHYFVIVILAFCKYSSQASTVDSPTYTAAVVEYFPIVAGIDGKEIAEANSNNYLTIIKTASTYNVDIIVFPEFGLSSLPKDGNREKIFNATGYRNYYRDVASYVPHPEEAVVLCNASSKYAKSLQKISCAARDSKLYVVVNHQEKVDCEPNSSADCAPDGFLLYNTNIVFDREGRVVARYRKFNPFNEFGTNVTVEPEHSSFQTDFGVTFGQFICFDLLHQKPSIYFVNNPDVKDVIFSTHWFDYPPFLEATEIQAAWAYAADVNFLASGYSDAITASGGSGIYGGKMGPIVTYHPMKTSNALVIGEVLKYHHREKQVENLKKPIVYEFNHAEVPTITGIPPRVNLSQNFKDGLLLYTSELLDVEKSSVHVTTLCDRDICCDFHVETSFDKKVAAKRDAVHYKYRIVAFNGVTTYGNMSTSGLEVCALVTCAGDSLENCGDYYDDSTNVVMPTRLDSVIITRRVNLDEPVLFFPTTLLLQTYEPLGSSDFAYLTSGPSESSLMVMHLIKPQTRLATFGIYGRRFDRDGEPLTMPSKAVELNISFMALVGLLAVFVVVGCWGYPRKTMVIRNKAE
ncbi:hypothetical protein TSAR_010107 [Trichomalopsis sarcophagae]|uniref:CN hydrolase domain-containing protein n=1 Tax=Trichomalopsis sarcophagae TaxID=543379 RepID=A0A232F1W1_9HYME|nr:hypothetical protein TSAR_010107 [Trichomalopsis sarcophagae]